MRQIVSEKNQAPLALPAAPKAICRNPPCLNKNNQSEQAKNLTVSPAHAAGSSPPLRMCKLEGDTMANL